MNTKLVSYLSVIALVIALVACFLPLGGKTVVDRVVGANPGPDSYSPYQSYNGVVVWSESQTMAKGTTTLCAFKSPVDATSTLDKISWRVTTGSLADTIYISTSTSAVATTSSPALATKAISASVTSNDVWTTVGGATGDNRMTGGTYVLVRTASTTPTSQAFGGRCKAVFTEI